jgi:hypothetical protein
MITVVLLVMVAIANFVFGLDVGVPSMLMGIGIAIDVMLATVSKFRDDDLSFTNWTLPIMATHIGFPAIGYYGFWALSQAYPLLGPALGMIGAAFVALFIYEVFSDWIGHKPIFGISSAIGKLFGFEDDDARRIVAIMAVSWDALWSGPAKSEAIGTTWTNSDVGFSFLIAGLVVAAAAQFSLYLALKLRKMKFRDANKMASFIIRGKLIETSVIGGFGVLSLSQGFGLTLNIYGAVGIAALMMSGLFLFFNSALSESSLEEAEEAITGG